MEKITATLPAGSVEYSQEAAEIPIQDLIDALESARSEGATHVVGLSGNYRGPGFVKLSAQLGWTDDEDF